MVTNTPRPLASFTTELDAQLVADINALATRSGLTLRGIVEPALADILARQHRSMTKDEAWRHYQASVEQFGELYRRLAE